MIEMFSFWFVKFIKRKIEFIIKKCIPKSPLKPSIKLDPLITNKKQSKTKQIWKILFSNHKFKNTNPDLGIWIEKILIQIAKRHSIRIKRIFGLIFIFKSSKKPNKNNNSEITK